MRRVGEALAGRYAEIGQAVAARIVEEIPGYRELAPELINDLRAGATATVELLARTFAEGSTIRREDLGFLRELAARRVHQGVSLEVFIHAYRVALLAFWDVCANEAARLRISREAGFALASSAIEAIDIITTQAAEAYLREETRLRTQSGRAARDLIERLIGGQPIDLTRRHRAAPGLDPTGQLLAIVGRVEHATLAVGDALQLARDTLEESMSLGKARPLVTIRHGEIVLVTTAGSSPAEKITSLHTSRQRALDEHEIDVRYGVSTPYQGFSNVQHAYRDAVLSLSYTSPARPIASLNDLSSLECALDGADATTRAVITSKGSDLLALSAENLSAAIETIRAFAKTDLNVARAAEEMHVHPNTVRYRLQRIATTTRHDPRTFAGLVELTCILEAIQTISATEPRPHYRGAAATSARCAVGGALETATEPIRPIGEKAGDYSIQVKIPGGFEYDEAEIAMATVLKGSGPIAFEHQTATAHSRTSHATPATSSNQDPRKPRWA